MKRRGLSLTEVLVVLAIVGLLLALLLPAVAAAREAVRQAACLSNLQAIGQALASYETTYRRYPMLEALSTAPNPRGTRSPLAALLPYLDQSVVYEQINLSLPCATFDTLQISSHPNHTAFATRLSSAVCPSDRTPSWSPAPCNYRFSTGSSPYEFVATGSKVAPDSSGAFALGFGVRPADIAGGLAHTAAASERLTGSGVNSSADRTRDHWYANPSGIQPDEAALENIWNAFSPASNAPSFRLAGATWLATGFQDTAYNHAATPNSVRYDLSDQPTPPVGYHATAHGGYFPARSAHRAGVNVVALDGSVRWTSDAVDLQVWKAIGTMAAD